MPRLGPSIAGGGDDREAALEHARDGARRRRRLLSRVLFLQILTDAGVAENLRGPLADRLVDHLEATGLELRSFR